MATPPIDPLSQEYQEAVAERRVKYTADAYSHAKQYENVIMLAGYAAFFGLWAGVADDVGPLTRLATAALMGASLFLYIVWHLIAMLTRQSQEWRLADAFAVEHDPTAFNARWDKVVRESKAVQLRVFRLWPYVFVPAVALGLAGALLLIGATVWGVAQKLLA